LFVCFIHLARIACALQHQRSKAIKNLSEEGEHKTTHNNETGGRAATMSTSTVDVPKAEPQPCRIVVMGVHRARVQKVVSLLTEQETDPLFSDNNVQVEYLPCVAKFDSYEDAQGQAVRYLVSVDYYGSDGSAKKPGGLVPFFDEEGGEADKEKQKGKTGFSFGAIAGVAINFEDDEDVTRLNTYFKMFTKVPILMECVLPNPEFSTMSDEIESFKALDAEAKKEVTRLQSMGPGKMAKFAFDLAKRLITDALEEQREPEQEAVEQALEKLQIEETVVVPRLIDLDKNRYSCRKCRTILFGEDDFEDPPHVPSAHGFSWKKIKHSGYGSTGTSACQSFFMASGLDWMGDVNATEGKFGCPKCETKLGSWNWSGAQCSCGSWVVPAIQIPRGKVDLVAPHQPAQPVGTIMSPLTVIQSPLTVIQRQQRIG
jgi:dual specificity phosphatase 12